MSLIGFFFFKLMPLDMILVVSRFSRVDLGDSEPGHGVYRIRVSFLVAVS